MENLAFFKPNRSNNGAALFVNFTVKDKGGKQVPMLFFQIVNQFSWDEDNKEGTFKDNMSDPSQNKSVKFSLLEAAALIRVVEQTVGGSNSEWKSFHKTEDTNCSLTFSSLVSERGSVINFRIGLSATEAFKISLTLDEAVLLREFLVAGVRKSFQS
jgi:hypothetical protein